MNKRFRALKRDIRLSIIDNDAFGIQPDRHLLTFAPIFPKAYEFKRTPQKISEFMAWLKEEESKGILQVTLRPGLAPGMEAAWTDAYIDSTYKQGIRQAGQELRRQGYAVPSLEVTPGGISAVMGGPVHADRVGVLYTRTFEDLKTVTTVMDSEIRRRLSDGLTSGLSRGIAEGKNPLVIARELAASLNDRVEHIGIARARMIARTEVIRAHHVATVTEYRRAGVEGVTITAEWMTAGFGVCEICLGFEERSQDRPYTLDEIEGMLPAHPH